VSLYGGIELVGRPDLENVRKLDLLPIRPVMEMMQYGMAIDIPHLEQLTETLTKEINELRIEICSYIPPEKLDEFIEKSNMDADDDYLPMNVESTKQMRKLLFEVLGVGKGHRLKMTKSGDISTGKRQMEARKQDHPVVPVVLKYREYSKLRGTYTSKLPRIAVLHREGKNCSVCGYHHLADTYRIHTQLMAARTSTGRYACVAWWTRIMTQRGEIPLAAVVVGDYVWTHQHRWKQVTAVWRKGIEQMYDVRFCNGHVLTCTKSHRLLTYSNEYFKAMVKQRIKYNGGHQTVSEHGVPNAPTDCRPAEHYVSYSPVDLQEQITRGGIQGAFGNPLLTVEGIVKEPDVWQDRGAAPQLDRFGGRWLRISDLLEGRQTAICPSYCDGRSFGLEGATGDIRCASYRHGYETQRIGQSGISHEDRPPQYPQDDEGQYFTSVEEITPRGCFEVFDISVADDESYLACGVFSHNSKDPNLQNIPARSAYGKETRKAFIASPGTVIAGVDFAQLQLRILAHCAHEEKMIWIFENGKDPHTMTAAWTFEVEESAVVKEQRDPSKNVNFALVFGETPRGLYEQLVSDS